MLAEEKDALYNKIVSLVAAVPDEEILLTSGDLNGHVGEHSAGCQGVDGGNSYGVINHGRHNGLLILDFGVANKLQLLPLSFKRKLAGLLHIHPDVIRHRLTTS